MKNFSKKLSFVMATAMVVTSLYAPQGAEAATKNKIVVKNGKAAVKNKNIYIGGKVVDFDAVVKGKVVKDSKGTWKSSNKKIASVDKNGKVKALKNGKVTISFKTKATKKTKSVTVKMTINARTRASKMTLTPSAVVVKEGEKSTVGITYDISKKIKAAGGKTTTYKLFAESSDEKVAKVSVEGNNKVVVEGVAKSATPVSITVYAAQVSNLAKAKEVRIKLTEKFDVKVNGKFDAKQVRANKISVVGTNLSTKAAAYVVKNTNGIVLNLKDNVEVNEAGTVATLESVVGQIPAGLYTVTFEKEEPVEFTAVKQVVEKIVIEPADKLILKGIDFPNNKTAYAYYKVLDNFGEDVTEQPLGANIYANGTLVTKKGEVEFTNNNGFMLGTTYGLTLVDQNSGKTATATLTVSRESVLSEASFKGLYDKKENKFVKTLGERADLSDYVLLFEGKDQYGRKLNRVKSLQVTIGGATGLMTKADNVDQVKVDGVEYMTKGLSMFTQNKLNAGEATVQAFSLESGKQSTPAKINVVASTEVKTLSIGNGPKTIVAGEEAELSYSAVDADGKPVTDYEVLRRVVLNGGKDNKGVRFVKKAGKAVLMYMPAADANIATARPEYISYVTLTNNVGTATVTVNPARVPTKIAGLKKDTATGITATGTSPSVDNTLYVTASSIILKDQYGDDIDFDKLGTDYKIRVNFGPRTEGVFATYGAISGSTLVESIDFDKTALATPKNVNIVKAIATAPAISKSVNVEISVLKKDGTDFKELAGSKYTFKLSTTNTAAVKDVRIEDIDLAEASSGTAVNYVVPEVTGTIAGSRVTLIRGKDYQIISGTDRVPDLNTLTNGATEGKATVSIILLNDEGKRIDKEYTFSKKAPVVAEAEVKDGSDGEVVSASSVVAVTNVLNALKIKDQYGNTYTTSDLVGKAYVTFKDLPDKAEVSKNGGYDAKITAGVKQGDVITVKIVFSGSSYVFEKEMKIHNN